MVKILTFSKTQVSLAQIDLPNYRPSSYNSSFSQLVPALVIGVGRNGILWHSGKTSITLRVPRLFSKVKIFCLRFCTVSMRRPFRTCAYEFLTTVTKGVVHGVHKVETWSSFGVILRHKVS